MSRLINADELIAVFNSRSTINVVGDGLCKAIIARIEAMPTVDAVPVVLCKDCKFSKAYYHGSESNLGMFTYLCTQGLYGMNAYDYCSRAERKEPNAHEC